jgi:hypothetical protein
MPSNIKSLYLLMHYRRNQIFFFSQITQPLSQYTYKYRKYNHINGFKFSHGACISYVFFFIHFFQEYNLSVKNKLFEEIKDELSNHKKMMPHLYFWMGLQAYLCNDFNSINSFPDFKKEFDTIFKLKSELNYKFKNDIRILNKNDKEEDFEFFAMHCLFLERYAKKWEYSGTFLPYYSFKEFIGHIDKIYLEELKKNKYHAICISIGLSFINDKAHAVCLIITKDISYTFYIFDPNFGLYKFISFAELSHFFKYLSVNRYNTKKYSGHVLYLPK